MWCNDGVLQYKGAVSCRCLERVLGVRLCLCGSNMFQLFVTHGNSNCAMHLKNHHSECALCVRTKKGSEQVCTCFQLVLLEVHQECQDGILHGSETVHPNGKFRRNDDDDSPVDLDGGIPILLLETNTFYNESSQWDICSTCFNKQYPLVN